MPHRPADELIEAIAAHARGLCGTDTGLGAIVQEQRHWLAASHTNASAGSELQRCVDLLGEAAFIEIEDARSDPRCAGWPVVAGAAPIRFVAAVGVPARAGSPAAALCVMDVHPRRLAPEQARALRGLGSVVSHALAIRHGAGASLEDGANHTLRELTTIFDNTPDFVVQTDGQGRVVYMNPAARRGVGLQLGEPLGEREFGEFLTSATRELFAHTILTAVRDGTVWIGETTVKLAARPEVPVSHMVIAHRDEQGRIERYSSVMRDISGAMSARQEARRQTDILRSVTEAIPATVVVVGNDGRYRFVNSAFERYCGLPREQIIGRPAAEVLSEAEIERRRPWMKRAFAGEPVSFTLDYPKPDGTTYLSLACIPLRAPSGEVDGFVGVSQDVTAQKREEERLIRLAQRDPLTSLLNRAGFESGLAMLLQSAVRPGLGVLYIDLDNFKPVNDQHGHPAGDQLLQLFAQRLVTLVRPTDLVARLGGDEFAIAMVGLPDTAPAAAAAEKVVVAARAPYKIADLQLTVGASVGVAFDDADKPDWREALARADAQLLRAKAAGKGRQLGGADTKP